MQTYTVTIRRPDGYVFNHQIRQDQLREWLRDAGSVLLPGETLSYVAALTRIPGGSVVRWVADPEGGEPQERRCVEQEGPNHRRTFIQLKTQWKIYKIITKYMTHGVHWTP